MRLIIAEKPSLARAIAAAIPGRHRNCREHIECCTGDVIAWCAGHVLAMAPPEDYGAVFKAWRFDTLPIIPELWQHRVRARELVASLRRLLAKAARVVHAGDPDREGQLLVDEVLLHLGWRGPTERLLVTDLSPEAVGRALAALEPNERYRPLYEAALARQRADWLYGMNLTRLYTLRAQLAGYRGVVSVGRVQTPVLGLIVRRDREIEAFVTKPFYAVEAELRSVGGAVFQAVWAVGKEHQGALDPEGRLLDRRLASTVAAQVVGQVGVVRRHEEQPRSNVPPLPYSLAALQIDAGRLLGLSAARVLESAQRLYERQLITYPRSDCSYLPVAHWAQARGVLAAVRETAPAIAEVGAAADLNRRGRAWNDAKVTAHHAVIPTANATAVELADTERALYELVARRYLQQFHAPYEWLDSHAEIFIAGELFVARGRRTLVRGWTVLAVRSQCSNNDAKKDGIVLPPLAVGQRVACPAARVVDKQTQPPKPFTDATLIQAMCGVAKFVSDERARNVLKETDGIGTPATRAAIIETLFAREYLERCKTQIRSTPVGQALIDALPTVATTPDLTAVWESAMQRIGERELGLDRFLGAVAAQLDKLVTRGKAAGPLSLPTVPAAQRPSTRRRRKGQGRPRVASARRQGRPAEVVR